MRYFEGILLELPRFRYHPHPLDTGFVNPSEATCRCCGEQRSYTYAGPTYSAEEVEDLCPWCIADGGAATRFDAHFTDAHQAPRLVPADVIDEIVHRTPGFCGWQQERWLFHCNDGAMFLGLAGAAELADKPGAVAMLKAENRGFGWSDEDIDFYISRLDIDGDATAYLFKCRHCDTHLAYSDFG